LRRHIKGGAYNRFKNGAITIIEIPCEAKVTDFKFPVFDEDVGWFKVSMHNFLAAHVLKTSHNVFKET
jgi:hypothetical protein